MRTALTATALAILVTTAAIAGPLRPDRVGAGAEWVVHVDVEALHRSTIGRFILENADDLGIDMSDMNKMRDDIGIDLRTDIMSVTAYGPTGDGDGDGVIIVVTNSNADEAIARAMAMPEVESELHDIGGYPVYALTSDEETMYVHLRPDAGRRIVVASDEADAVLRALRVIDGKAENAKEATIIPRKPRSGSIVFATAREADLLEEFEPVSDIARLSDMISIDVGEDGGELFAHAAIAAGNEHDAKDVTQVVQGLIALGRLLAGQDPELEPLRAIASALQVTSEGADIHVQFEYPTRPLLEAMKEAFEDGDDDNNNNDNDDDD